MSDRRLGSLQDILAQSPRPRAAAAADPPRAVRPPTDPTPAPPRRGSPATGPGRARIPLRLDPSLHQALSEAARARGTTLAVVAFEAIEAAHHAGRLGEVVAARATAEAAPTHGSLFSRPRARTTSAKSTAELRMSASDREVIDRLCREHGTTRTHLIESALRDHLGDGP